MAHNWSVKRARQLSCLFLFVGLVLPLVLRLFLTEEPSPPLYNHREVRRRSVGHNKSSLPTIVDGFIVNGYAHLSGDKKARSSIMNTMIGHDGNDHHLSDILHVTELFEHQITRKRGIHAIVTTIVALIVPLAAFLSALVSNKITQRNSRKSRRVLRRERILQILQGYRIRFPAAKDSPRAATSANDDYRDDIVECPICLSAFEAGEIAVVSNDCECNTAANSDRIDAAGEDGRHHRIYFHEGCIAAWLSQRRTNPKKLCPCCRKPFLSSSLQSSELCLIAE